MKRFFILAASIGLLAACSGLEQPEPDLFLDMDGDLVEKVVFEVLPIKDGDNPETRASAVPNGGSVGFVWEATDTVGIYPGRGSQVYFNIEDGVGSNSVSFTGGDWALKQNATYTSYYPFVGDIYLKRDKIPVSFAGQKQIGTTSPFIGARYFLATESTSSKNGVLQFSYNTLNTIINVNATLPAGTYTKASLTIEEPLFVEEGTYSLDDRVIVGTKFSNTLEIDLENVTLTQEGVLPIYIMSAPVDLKDKEVTVRFISSEGQYFECIKKPSKAYEAGTRYGLTCDKMVKTNVVFEDENFKSYCVEMFDSDGDGEVSYAEANVVTNISCYNQGISSLKGIEHFINLTWLSCDSNQLTSLDVSHNTALTYFACTSNQLTNPDVSHNTALTSLYCQFNQLTSLDVSHNTNLTTLCCYNNQLKSLDVSHNTVLTRLSCDSNQLTSLDISHNTVLERLYCDSNQLTSLDVSHNTELVELYCGSNQLTSLDVSHNTALLWFGCQSNQLTSLNVSKNITLISLYCGSNQLTSLDVSLNTELINLFCEVNQLDRLDVSQNTALGSLSCNGTFLTSLDVSHNTALSALYCETNLLTSLDVSLNLSLNTLACHNNPSLTEIWLKTGQTISDFSYDTGVATIKYKD